MSKNIIVLGSINYDLMISVNSMPAKGETVHGFDYIEAIGGKGSNQAAASSKLGANTYLFGAVGKDLHGERSLKVLKNFNVNIENVAITTEYPTGTAFVITSEEDNRIIINEGANGYIKNESLQLIKLNKKGDIFVTQLENPINSVEKAISFANKSELITVFNPAPAATISEDLLSKINYMILNQTETEFYTGIYPESMEDCIEAGEILLSKGVQNIIITLGAKGCMALNETEKHYVPGHTIKVTDTTGAGDTFIGAFVFALSEEMHLLESLELANIAGALACTKYGAKESIPSFEALLEFEEKIKTKE